MDYYEELGIRPSATAEEIHRAHRRLTKLMHPDQHTDEDVKALAETQMRRLNVIVDILSDPDRRREYDEELAGKIPLAAPVMSNPRWVKVPRGQRLTWRSVPWWVGSTIGAVVLTVGLAWYWADNLGSSFGSNSTQVYVRSPQDSGAQVQPPAPAPPSNQPAAPSSDLQTILPSQPAPRKTPPTGLGRISSRIRDAILPAKSSHPAPSTPPPQSARSTGTTVTSYQAPRPPLEAKEPMTGVPVQSVSTAEPPASDPAPRQFKRSAALASAELVRPTLRNVEVPPPPAMNTSVRAEMAPVPLPALPKAAAPPTPTEAAPPPAPASKVTVPAPTAKVTYQHPFEGEWVYAPKEPEKRKPGLYPPEFIDMKLVWNEGRLHGQYRARYQVTDRPISPDVSFLISPVNNAPRKFVWQSSSGSRGTLQINQVDPQTIHVEWRTTVFGSDIAFTAGTATLVRRTP